MISLEEAHELVRGFALPLPSVRRAPADCLGLVLAGDVRSPVDCPAYDKAMMDGFAVRSQDISSAQHTLTVIEEVTAGSVPRLAVPAGCATRIMTGSPIPAGADAVVMLEETTRSPPGDATRVTIHVDTLASGRNVMPRGNCLRSGEDFQTSGRDNLKTFALVEAAYASAASGQPAVPEA